MNNGRRHSNRWRPSCVRKIRSSPSGQVCMAKAPPSQARDQQTSCSTRSRIVNEHHGRRQHATRILLEGDSSRVAADTPRATASFACLDVSDGFGVRRGWVGRKEAEMLTAAVTCDIVWFVGGISVLRGKCGQQVTDLPRLPTGRLANRKPETDKTRTNVQSADCRLQTFSVRGVLWGPSHAPTLVVLGLCGVCC